VSLPGTPSQTVGPFFAFGLCDRPLADVVEPGREGAIRIEGSVVDGEGNGLDDALVEIWQADASGEYRPDFGWARSGTDAEGRFALTTIKPGAVAGQAPHLDVLVFARGLLKPVRTRLYFPDEDEANASDPVLAGLPDPADRDALVAQAEAGVLRFEVRLQGERQTPFFAL
jgi:protocatechuate 3,4-dioxygenase alpha subunit